VVVVVVVMMVMVIVAMLVVVVAVAAAATAGAANAAGVAGESPGESRMFYHRTLARLVSRYRSLALCVLSRVSRSSRFFPTFPSYTPFHLRAEENHRARAHARALSCTREKLAS